jgi:ribosome-associated protein
MAKTHAAAKAVKTRAASDAAKTSEEKPAAAKKPRLPKAVAAAVGAALDKKGVDIVVLDLRKADGFTDYFVIATAMNARQIHAIAGGIEETLRKDLGERPTLAEGMGKSEWILLDYFNFVVHVFSRECRSFYALERLWGNAERYEFSDGA